MNLVPVSSALSLFAALSTALPGSAPSTPVAPGGLRRLGVWGFALRPEAEGARVYRLVADGPAAEAGLRDGDLVVRVAGEAPRDAVTILRLRRKVRAGEPLALDVVRDGRRRSFRFALPALPLESIPGCEVIYGAAPTPAGHRIRTILTRPSGARGARPTVVFIPWLSEDAVEAPTGNPDGWILLLQGLSRRGWQVVRLEKPGSGDSDGPETAANDLETDLAAFRAGLASVRAMPEVDARRIVLFGGSIGAALAPVLAREAPPAALIVSGGFSRTWREHMVEFERERLRLAGEPAATLEEKVRGFADFYALYLGEKLTPGEAIARRPELKSLWYDAPDSQFGRPAAYYHQVEALPMRETWASIDAPTLILYGEYDWIMSREEHEHMADAVNRRHPGRATLEVLPATGHNLEKFASREASFRGEDAKFDPALVELVAGWLDRTVR